jgi:hypothetical protein
MISLVDNILISFLDKLTVQVEFDFLRLLQIFKLKPPKSMSILHIYSFDLIYYNKTIESNIYDLLDEFRECSLTDQI